MTAKCLPFSRKYLEALRAHLAGPTRQANSAANMGLAAAKLQLEPQLFAIMHVQALATLEVGGQTSHRSTRAAEFFTQACAASAAPGAARLRSMLVRRTADLATANLRLREENTHRRDLTNTLKENGRQYRALLKESLHIQQNLRQLTHHLLAVQEDERTRLSRELQNEITQTLVGINVRLIALKREAQKSGRIENGIASAQRLVLASQRSIRRIGREAGNS